MKVKGVNSAEDVAGAAVLALFSMGIEGACPDQGGVSTKRKKYQEAAAAMATSKANRMGAE
jgi:hypothetical protein